MKTTTLCAFRRKVLGALHLLGGKTAKQLAAEVWAEGPGEKDSRNMSSQLERMRLDGLVKRGSDRLWYSVVEI